MDHNTMFDVACKILEMERTKTPDAFLKKLRIDISDEEKSKTIKAAYSAFDIVVAQSSGDDISSRIRALLTAKKEDLANAEDALNESVKQAQSLSLKEATVSCDGAYMHKRIETNKVDINELQERCRNLQIQYKQSLVEVDSKCEDEKVRTAELQKTWHASIDDVVASLEKEELLLADKRRQNIDIRKKIDDLSVHLAVREKQMEAAKRAKELKKELSAAKMAQKQNYEDHSALKMADYAGRLALQKTHISGLRSKLNDFKKKFSEFSGTLILTGEMFASLDTRSRESTSKATALETKNRSILNRAEARSLELQRLRAERGRVRELQRALQLQCDEAEKKCREAAARRAQVKGAAMIGEHYSSNKEGGAAAEGMTTAVSFAASQAPSSSSSASSSSSCRRTPPPPPSVDEEEGG